MLTCVKGETGNLVPRVRFRKMLSKRDHVHAKLVSMTNFHQLARVDLLMMELRCGYECNI